MLDKNRRLVKGLRALSTTISIDSSAEEYKQIP